jgi:hypothetical protein
MFGYAKAQLDCSKDMLGYTHLDFCKYMFG